MLNIAGDIGGTKTHLALLDDKNPQQILKQKNIRVKILQVLKRSFLIS